MNQHIGQLKKAISSYQQQIVNHKLYNIISTENDLKVFMQHHVFAVWDFMSLLKALQINLTCVQLPWLPVGSAQTRYLINEIVTGEESDIDEYGNRISHFELYLNAMQQSGANTAQIKQFLVNLQQGKSISQSLVNVRVEPAVSQFVSNTFEVIATQKPHIMAAVFTFGREDLIPEMFLSIVNDIYKRLPESLSTFKYYLERHIEIDGDHHSNLATEMLVELCGEDSLKWQQATEAAIESLKCRIALWDSVYNQLEKKLELI